MKFTLGALIRWVGAWCLASIVSRQTGMTLRCVRICECQLCCLSTKVFLPDATPEDLMKILQQGLSLRRQEATERNPMSSRSHAVCELRVHRHGDTVERSLNQARDTHGCLRIVDLAGSERNYETQKMTAAMHRESATINTELMALKVRNRRLPSVHSWQCSDYVMRCRIASGHMARNLVSPSARAVLLR